MEKYAQGHDDDFLKYLENDSEYNSQIEDRQALTQQFVSSYHQSLFYYKMFYNDLNELGNLNDCTDILYFVPGFNGTPGQIQFGLPGIIKHFGPKIYLRSLYTPALSCKIPTWAKYDAETLAGKRAQIVKDLFELVSYGKRVKVIVSSSGFYDFLSAYPELIPIKDNLILYWVSCAPDSVSPNRWQKFFYPINGFKYQGHKWFSYPNWQWMKLLNPECGRYFNWKHGTQKTVYQKNELESRFFYKGVMWDYISIDLFNDVLQQNLQIFNQAAEKIDMEVYALAGIKDGFWDDSSPANIEATLGRYIKDFKVLYKQSSHLWVVTPEHIYDLLQSS